MGDSDVEARDWPGGVLYAYLRLFGFRVSTAMTLEMHGVEGGGGRVAGGVRGAERFAGVFRNIDASRERRNAGLFV